MTSIRSILRGYNADIEQNQNINEQYQNQFDSAIKAFEENNPLKQKNYSGYREVTFFPATSFDGKRFELGILKNALKQASVDFTGWPFIFVGHNRKELYMIQDGIESLVSFPDFGGNDRLDFWRLYTSGLFYHRTLMWEESKDRKNTIDINYVLSKTHKGPTMEFLSLTQYVAEAVNALTLLYNALGLDDEPVTARFRILGTDNRLLTSNSRLLRMPYIAKISEITEERTYNLSEWNAGVTDLSISIIKSICLKFNWEDPPTSVFKADIEKLFSRRF